MLAESRPLMFKSLTSKLLECGILSLSQKGTPTVKFITCY